MRGQSVTECAILLVLATVLAMAGARAMGHAIRHVMEQVVHHASSTQK